MSKESFSGCVIKIQRNLNGSLSYSYQSNLTPAEVVMAMEDLKLSLLGVKKGPATGIEGFNPKRVP